MCAPPGAQLKTSSSAVPPPPVFWRIKTSKAGFYKGAKCRPIENKGQDPRRGVGAGAQGRFGGFWQGTVLELEGAVIFDEVRSHRSVYGVSATACEYRLTSRPAYCVEAEGNGF